MHDFIVSEDWLSTKSQQQEESDRADTGLSIL